MPASPKKVILRMLDGSTLAGYLPAAGMVDRASRIVDLLDTAGRHLPVQLGAIRYVAFVRDFNLHDAQSPERLMRKTFQGRPRTEGLWVRATFSDGEVLEGLASLDLSLLTSAAEDEGLFLIPPDVRSNTQRLYIPRSALIALQVLAVVTTPTRAAAARKAVPADTGPVLPFPEN